jgi:hypothetical protein
MLYGTLKITAPIGRQIFVDGNNTERSLPSVLVSYWCGLRPGLSKQSIWAIAEASGGTNAR